VKFFWGDGGPGVPRETIYPRELGVVSGRTQLGVRRR